jgi:hypothetical protein
LRHGSAAVSDDAENLRHEIAAQRARLAELERQLGSVAPASASWPPRGFYLTFHVVAGLMIGVLGSITSFLFHIVGSLLVNQDPLYVLRVWGTVFLGERALTTTDLNFFMLVAVVHFSIGAVAGAVFHVLVSFFVPDRPLRQIALGAAYGLAMWVVNFYFVLVWLQPRLVGDAYVLQLMPPWIAALTHLIYGLTLGALQPLGRFQPYRGAAA